MARKKHGERHNPAIASKHTDQAIQQSENIYYKVLAELAANRFKWVGLPPEIDHRYIEHSFITNNMMAFFYDKNYNKFFFLKGAQAGQPNLYGNPTKVITYGNGAYPSRTISTSNAVPVWCNYFRVPDIGIIMHFADKLMTADRTVDINMMQQRSPWMLAVPEHMRLSVTQIMNQVYKGEPVIPFNPTLNLSEVIQTLPTTISDNAILNMILSKQKIWNECMTLLGINNANQDKKERLVSDEVDANDEQVESARGMGLNSRLEGCELINKRFGLNVSVEWQPLRVSPLGEDPMTDDGGAS